MSSLRGGQARAILLMLILGAVSIGAYRILLTQQATDGDHLETHLFNEPGEFTPSEPGPGDSVRVFNLRLNSSEVAPGEPVGVLIGLENLLDQPVDYTLSLWVSGELEDEREVSLGEEGTIEVDFTVRRSDQGKYEVKAANLSQTFEVCIADLFVVGLKVEPTTVEPGESAMILVRVYNPNAVEVTQIIDVSIDGKQVGVELTAPPYEEATGLLNITMWDLESHHISVGEYYTSFLVEGLEVLTENVTGPEDITPEEPTDGPHDTLPAEPPEEPPVTYVPMKYVPDPMTDGFTCVLPPEASPIRLTLPCSLDDLFCSPQSGPGGFGVHAGGHIEGLDHVWIEIREGVPAGSWANGTVIDIQLSGDEEHGEYHIYIDYGQNLVGVHMEVATPLVEVGDYVERGQPVGYGMSFFEGVASAELGLVDLGRSDGVPSWGGGVNVSPYDYLEDDVKLALVEAYKANMIEAYVLSLYEPLMLHPYQPYLTNNLFIHEENEGRLTGAWYLVSAPWEPVYPNDVLTFVEADNPYYTGNVVMATDDRDDYGRADWNIWGTFEVDYEAGRIRMVSEGPTTYYGIFEIDESGGRAVLRIQYRMYDYPQEWTDEALYYVERGVNGRRGDAVELGVLDEP
ncbi:hypothetical protein ES703_10287 [subsurface metagenome]